MEKRNIIQIIPFGIFNMVVNDDALITNYLVGTTIKNNCCYLNEVTLNKLLSKLDSVHIDYCFNNVVHNFTNNNYELYLGYSYKKKEIMERYEDELNHIEDV